MLDRSVMTGRLIMSYRCSPMMLTPGSPLLLRRYRGLAQQRLDHVQRGQRNDHAVILEQVTDVQVVRAQMLHVRKIAQRRLDRVVAVWEQHQGPRLADERAHQTGPDLR